MIPKVSVLVTVYNRDAFLADTLESILRSSFDDFEVIVVDDNSSDGSLDVAREICARDSRIQVHKNASNLSDYPNRMQAAALARGEYLKYVDSDDLIYPHSLKFMVQSMEKYPEATLALSHSMSEDESPYPWFLSPQEAYRKEFLGRGCLSCGPSGAIFRRDAFELLGGFRSQWSVLSDLDLWFRLAARWPIVLLPPGLVWWRRHDNQEFTRDDAALSYLQGGYALCADAMANAFCPLGDSEKSAVLAKSRQHFARKLMSLAVRGGRIGSSLRIYRNSDLTLSDLLTGFRTYR